MFLSIQTRNNVKYLYLVENKYDPVKKRGKKIIRQSFGRLDDFVRDKPQEYARLQQQYANKKDKHKAQKEQTIQQFFGRTEEDYALLQGIKGLMPQKYAHLLLRRMWNDTLKMPDYFAQLAFREKDRRIEYNPSEIALYFTMLRMISPMSYLAGLQESPRFLGDPLRDISSDDVYRCLAYLSEHKDELMRHINRRIDKLVPRNRSLLFYDCTNCYFETPYNDEYWFRRKAQRLLRRQLRREEPKLAELSDLQLNQIIKDDLDYSARLDELIEELGEPLRMHGMSKEKRTDLPLVSVALVIDENAMPVDFQVYAGNQAESSTLKTSIGKLKQKHHLKHATVIADSGLTSTKNLCMLLKEELGFAVAKSALSLESKIREQELDLSTFRPILDESGHETSMLYKTIPYHKVTYSRTGENGRRERHELSCSLMLTFSEKRRQRDLNALEELTSQAQRAVNNREEVKLKKSGWKQFVLTSPLNSEADSLDGKVKEDNAQTAQDKGQKTTRQSAQIASALNTELISKRKQCAGFAGILYHEPPEAEQPLQPQEVSSLYHQLVQIEECFRVMKGEFSLRPMFVRERISIEGHVLLCVFALLMMRMLQRQIVATSSLSLTIEQIQQHLSTMNLMLLSTDADHSILLKSVEAPRRNCMRHGTDEFETGSERYISDEIIFRALGYERSIEPVTTMQELKRFFKIQSLEKSSFQDELLTKYYRKEQAEQVYA